MKTLFIALITVFTLQFACAQKLKARVDQVLHSGDVTEMIISPDKKHFATADVNGMVVMRDIKTGKVIAHHKFDGLLIDIFYAKKEGHIIGVYIKDEFSTEYIIEIIDFLNQKTTYKEKNEFNNKDIEIDFFPRDNILVSTNGNTLTTYNFNTFEVNYFEYELPYLVAGINSDKNIEILNYDGDWGSGVYYKYNYETNTNTQINNKSFGNSYLDFDMNNKNMFRKNGKLIFTDNLIDITFEIPEANFYYKDGRIENIQGPLASVINAKMHTIEDFAFSEDRKYLAIVGGEEPEEAENSDFTSSKDVGIGFVALYSIEDSKLVWITTGKAQQTKNMTNDLDWIDNENLVTSDALGNTIFYHISEEKYSRSYYLPQRYGTDAVFNSKFDSLTYKLFNNEIYKFNTKNPELARQVDEGVYSKIKASRTLDQDGDEYDLIVSKMNSVIESLDPNELEASISKIITSRDKKYAALELFFYEDLDIDIPKRLVQTQSNEFTFNDIRFVDLEPNAHEGGKKSIDEVEYIILLLNMQNPNESTFFLLSDYDEIQFSYESNYFNINYINSLVYDVTKNEITNYTENKLKYTSTVFDEHSSNAFSLGIDENLIFWNTKNNKTISTLNINDVLADEGEEEDDEIDLTQIQVDESNHIIYFVIDFGLYKYHYKTGQLVDTNIGDITLYFKFSSDFRYQFSNKFHIEKGISLELKSNKTNKTIYNESIIITKSDSTNGYNFKSPIFYHKEKPLAFIPDTYGEFRLIDLAKEKLIATLKFFPDGEWLVYTPNGIFDGSKEGRKNLYYLSGTEVILYDQLKETYWESDLLNKLINNPGLIQSTSLSQNIELQPEAKIDLIDGDGNIEITLIPRSGGIGRVSFYINDKEIIEDINKSRKQTIHLNLLDYKDRLYTAGINTVGIKTYNKEGWLQSKIINQDIDTNIDGEKGADNEDKKLFSTSRRRRSDQPKNKPGLFGLFVGTSKYQNEGLTLNYADKDANILNDAFQKISKNMYDPSRVNLTALTTESTDPKKQSSKINILKAFDEIAKEAKPNDIIVLFFSGHGMTISDDFYYMTSTAGNVDLNQRKDKRIETCVSSKEINQALKNIKSNKQILILDACHSGEIAKLLEKKDKAMSTSQQKALESLEDKTGVYILASSEAEQKSFEADALTHGLLTFSLLRGMSGEATEGDIINVIDLLSYASKEAENIGKQELGKSQRPVLGISKGGSSFPIGFKNASLKVDLPKNKIRIGKPNFISIPLYNDPEKLTAKMLAKIKELGSIGSKEPFVFERRDGKELYKFTGSYKVSQNEIMLTWNILKDDKVFAGPFEETIQKSDNKAFTHNIINKAIERIRQ